MVQHDDQPSETLSYQCLRCARLVSDEPGLWRCPHCHGALQWRGPAVFNREMIDIGDNSIWRYANALPSFPTRITLGEGMTPLVPFELDGVTGLAKLDFLSPTGSYKDRGAAVLMSHLAGQGVRHAIEDSSGNAAAAIAGYAARAGMDCTIFAPATASRGKLVQAAAFGATVVPVQGSREDVATAAIATAEERHDASYASHNWHPLFIEGVKTWALELWEQCDGRMPAWVVVPVGAGSLLLGAFQAFNQLVAGGEIDRLPRLVACQPASCAPVVHALEAGLEVMPPVTAAPTVAEGTAIRQPVRGPELLAALRASDGTALAVSESEIVEAMRAMGRQGIFIEPTSAVAVAGWRQLVARGDIDQQSESVVLLSGAGLKATETIARLLDPGTAA